MKFSIVYIQYEVQFSQMIINIFLEVTVIFILSVTIFSELVNFLHMDDFFFK